MSSLSAREEYVGSLIATLRERGWGFYRIGRRLWPWLNPRTAQMRAYRLYKKYVKFKAGGPTIRNNNYNDSTRRPGEIIEDENIESLKKLGRTQKLVLYALRNLGGRARFTAVVLEVATMLGLHDGRDVLKKRVWNALQRLRLRGLVDSYGGVYWLTRKARGPSRVMVENFRVEGPSGRVELVWAKRRGGTPIDLDEALTLATLSSARRTVQVELASGLTKRFSRLMGSLGVSIIKVYRDPRPPYRGRAKVEVSFDRPPELVPSIVERDNWIRSFLRVIRCLALSLIHGGLVGGLSLG